MNRYYISVPITLQCYVYAESADAATAKLRQHVANWENSAAFTRPDVDVAGTHNHIEDITACISEGEIRWDHVYAEESHDGIPYEGAEQERCPHCIAR